MSTTILNSANGIVLKNLLFPTKVNLNANIFKKTKTKTNEINSANRKIVKNKATKDKLIEEIKELYKKLNLEATATFFVPTGVFKQISAKAAVTTANFQSLYDTIIKKIGTKNTINNVKNIKNIRNEMTRINTKAAPTGITTPAAADTYTVHKLYQLYLIVYYLNKLVSIDERELQRQSLYKAYQKALSKVDEFVKGKVSSVLIDEMKQIITIFKNEILQINNLGVGTNDNKISRYINSFENNIKTLDIIQDLDKLNLFFLTNSTINNIFDYVFNIIILRSPIDKNRSSGSSVPVQSRNVIKNVKNIDSRKLLLQLIKVLGKIMPEFKSVELQRKLKKIKDETNTELVSNLGKLNNSLIQFLSK